MPRLFTGLEIPADVAQSLAVAARRPAGRALDRSRELSSHAALHRRRRRRARARGRVAARPGAARARSSCGSTGCRRSAGASRARWSRRWRPRPALMELQAEHERLMQRIGLEPEGRKYTPHVTLARLRETSSRQVADYLALRAPYPLAAVPGLALRAVLLARLGRRRALRGRGRLSACRVRVMPAAAGAIARPAGGREAMAVGQDSRMIDSGVGRGAAPRRSRCRNRSSVRRRTCAPVRACGGCRRGRPCAATSCRDCGRRAGCVRAAPSRRRGSARASRS